MKLELIDIEKSFNDKKVLNKINFIVNKGNAMGLLGRNGSGKTTTIRILLDIFKQDSGQILLNSKPFDVNEYKIGYLPEERGLYPKKKVKEQLIYFGMLKGMTKKAANLEVEELLEKLKIDIYKNSLLDSLSKGNQQKVQLVQSILANPDIVFLDEPFSGLDPVNAELLKELVRELIKDEKLVIFSSHEMSYVEEFCEDITIINQGEVVLTGNLNQIKNDLSMGKIRIKIKDKDTKQVKELIPDNDIFIWDEESKKFPIFIINDGKTQKDCYLKLSEYDLEIEEFCIYKPSLNDIFITKVGDKNE